jgi:hypothetical protein
MPQMVVLANPEDFNEQLTRQRLATLERLIREARKDAFAMITDKRMKWTMGCGTYQLTKLRIEDLAPQTDWLRYHPESGMAYSFSIGSVPIRAQRLDQRPKAVLSEEAKRLKLAAQGQLFAALDEAKATDYMLRLEYEADGDEAGSFELRVRSRSDESLLYHRWVLGAEEPSNIQELPRPEAEILSPAAVVVVDAANDDSKEEVG